MICPFDSSVATYENGSLYQTTLTENSTAFDLCPVHFNSISYFDFLFSFHSHSVFILSPLSSRCQFSLPRSLLSPAMHGPLHRLSTHRSRRIPRPIDAHAAPRSPKRHTSRPRASSQRIPHFTMSPRRSPSQILPISRTSSRTSSTRCVMRCIPRISPFYRRIPSSTRPRRL